eukprot:5610356-Alexandrium_andersonii.AAC.1
MTMRQHATPRELREPRCRSDIVDVLPLWMSELLCASFCTVVPVVYRPRGESAMFLGLPRIGAGGVL